MRFFIKEKNKWAQSVHIGVYSDYFLKHLDVINITQLEDQSVLIIVEWSKPT